MAFATRQVAIVCFSAKKLRDRQRPVSWRGWDPQMEEGYDTTWIFCWLPGTKQTKSNITLCNVANYNYKVHLPVVSSVFGNIGNLPKTHRGSGSAPLRYNGLSLWKCLQSWLFSWFFVWLSYCQCIGAKILNMLHQRKSDQSVSHVSMIPCATCIGCF